MLKIVKCAVGILLFNGFSTLPLHAANFNHSGANDIWDNPFIAYGFNPQTKFVTGYLAALRTSPGRTDECKLAFSGNYDKSNTLSVKYLTESDGSARLRRANSSLKVEREGQEFTLKFRKDSLGGGCDWILPFVGEPRVRESANEVSVSLGNPNVGKWIGVYVIRSLKAKFHSAPDASTVQKAFLVEGDIIYCYKEQAEWYFVEFNRKKRKTMGWIKKTDTVQF